MIPRLKELYTKQIRSELKEKFSFKNSYMAPKIEKIVFFVFSPLFSFFGVFVFSLCLFCIFCMADNN